MAWHRLDTDNARKLLESVRSKGEALLFSERNNEVKCMRLPFCNDYLLYRIENTASLPIFSMDFLGSNEIFLHLDGTDQAFKELQKNTPLTLRDDNIAAYLQFFFFHVIQEEGEIYPIFDGGDPLPELTNQNIHASQPDMPAGTPQFTAAKDGDNYNVTTPLFYDGALMHGAIQVLADGTVTITSISPLLGLGRADTMSDART